MKKSLLITSFLLCTLYSWGIGIDIDTSYIIKYDDKLLLKISGNNQIEDFSISRLDNNFNLRPNALNKIRFLLSYRFVSAGFSLSPSFIQGEANDEDRKGNSQMYNFGANLNFDRWMQSLSYVYTKGFYLENTDDYVDNWNPDEDIYIQFPNVVYSSFSGYTAYKFNANYSAKSSSTQTERQIKSAGSFIPLLHYGYYSMNNLDNVYEDGPIRKSNNYEASFQLGYYYTHVIGRKWYISPGINSGVGIVHTRFRILNDEQNNRHTYTSAIFRSSAILGIGFNSRRWAAGINFTGKLETYPQNNDITIITSNNISGQLFVSYRFKTPNFVKKTVDKIPIPSL